MSGLWYHWVSCKALYSFTPSNYFRHWVRVFIFFKFCSFFTHSVVSCVLTEERLVWCLGTLPGVGAYWLHPQAITYIKPGSLPSLIFLDKWKSKIFNVQLSCQWYFHSWVIGSEITGLNSKLSADAMFEVARFNRCRLWREFYYASFPHRGVLLSTTESFLCLPKYSWISYISVGPTHASD